jgi:predicted nucleic acid-binding protein
MVLLDANILIYYLDETAEKNQEVIKTLQRLIDDQDQLVTTHHVIEEVLFVLSRIQPNIDLAKVVQRISEIPEIILVEPSAHFAFAERYASLGMKLQMGINDALLLQLMLDAGIDQLLSYDKHFVNRASELGIKLVA